MKNLKKISRADLSKIAGGYRNPNNPEWVQCYNVGYCYSMPNDVNGIGVPINHYDYNVPEGATNIRVCGWSAIIPAPAGC
ncbi:hypothetical protein JI747_008780 [Chryseobacterium sp. RG1]|uniref:Bacteriocin-type signal sequence-containing protein n=1 Tax=Chryseobacterium tagetis TaxID=2801334 RepID=A0ABS8A1N7_9FLAO|nr:hypothetical protein [Chryseobacterium tagetis]MCA6067268.1 hypothetical protein [Chryseobacterium tagetis]